jgi:2-polyprenyl-3-methyl-5-hydroxy-6-metoxy-1,4-benzoquinol methylase
VISPPAPLPPATAEDRARLSGGRSAHAIYALVSDVVRRHLASRRLDSRERRPAGRGTLVDVGCGSGALWTYLGDAFDRYVGVDVVDYDGFPPNETFVRANLNETISPIPAGTADVVAAVETIEHLENPRALVRELVRIARPGALVVVTTPNQLSALSVMTLLWKRRFAAFQDVHYPVHVTALLEVDLRRIARECGLHDISVSYTCEGRVVFTAAHYPRRLSRMFPAALSDNVLIAGRKPALP